jgi:ABC-type uncharacterized transport system ATPase subunit
VGFRERSNGLVSVGGAGRETPALELNDIVKRFGAVDALRGVDFTVARGSVHALLGENGAGKSTLMRIAYGLVAPDRGDVRLFGAVAQGHRPRATARAGVGMVHQHLSIIPSLTVTENFSLGGHGRFHPAAERERLRKTRETSGLIVPLDSLASALSIVEQQRLEILKALGRGAKLLILDEPTAVLAPPDINELLRWIRAFADGGGSVVLVTHKLREAIAVADDVTVLRRGQVVHTGPATRASEADLARAMFPEAEQTTPRTPPPAPGPTVVVAEDLHIVDMRGIERVRGASFRLNRHEIVGIAAIDGSGHRELLAALSGLRRISAGTLQLPSRRALIPADRLREALVPEFTLSENVALRDLGQRHGLMPWRNVAAETRGLIEDFAIAAPSPDVPARTLSGGNQQRLVVARALKGDVDLVVADNPTSGLDIRASEFVHDELRRAAARGAAVVVHSSDLDELLGLATRMLVVHHGVVLEAGMDREDIGRAMLGTGGAAIA